MTDLVRFCPEKGQIDRTGVTAMKTKKQAARIVAILEDLYPDAVCSLDYRKDYELLISTRLDVYKRQLPGRSPDSGF